MYYGVYTEIWYIAVSAGPYMLSRVGYATNVNRHTRQTVLCLHNRSIAALDASSRVFWLIGRGQRANYNPTLLWDLESVN